MSCPIPVGFDDLTSAIKEAKRLAIIRSDITSDEGPCNMNYAWVRITDGNRIAIIEAIKRGGLDAMAMDNSGMVRIQPPDNQSTGKKRTVQAETISEVLDAKGFISGVEYILD